MFTTSEDNMATRQIILNVGISVLAIVFTGSAAAQATAGTRVTGAEIDGWFATDQMAVAGIGTATRCHWITKGPSIARSQTVYCPGAEPFTVVGTAKVQGDQLCSVFTYPNGNRYEGCQDIYRVGDNKYEVRVNGVVRNVFYRLVP